MKYSNTAITQLTRWYKQILIKCAVFNAAILMGATFIATPAMADYTPVESRTVIGDEDVSFDNNSFTGLNTANYGGAIYSMNGAGSVTVSNSIFEGNSASGSGSYHQGGAIYINTNKAVVNSITNTIFDGNTTVGAASRGGAVYLNNNGSSTNIITTISDSTFTNNESIRADQPLNIMGSAIYQGGGTLNLNNTTFGGDTIDDANVGTTIVVTNNGTINLSGNTFQNNISKKEGVLSFNGAKARGNFEDENNFLNNDGHALYVFSGYPATDTTKAAGVVTFKQGSTTNFTGNSALNDQEKYGGALFNAANATATFEEGSEVNFTNNSAQKGGAIYNYATGVVNFNGDATFSGNTDENGANDIYNMGTLNFGNANEISITGGIDGDAGVVNVNGAGGLKIDHAALKNQTVNVASELHLDAADVTGSTINLGSDGVMNTINGVIEDYSAIELTDGANIKVDANLDSQKMDKFGVAGYGTDEIDLNIVEANMMGTATSADGVQLVNNGVKVNTSSVIYEWDDVEKTHIKTGIVGSGNADGKVNISNGVSVSNLEMAAADTQSSVKESVVYEMGENENFGSETVENANFIVEGNDQSVNISGTFGIDNQSVVTMNNVVFDGDGEITTYGKLKINDSEVNVDLNVLGGAQLESDPTSFSGTVTIDSLSTGSFDDDTFESTAVLKNSGTVDFTNMTFESGSRIEKDTTAGTLNFNGGDYDLVVTGNNINLKNGADIALIEGSDIDGLALTNDANNGTIDLRNKRIDTLGSTVLGSDLNVLMDVNLNTAKSDTLGTISGGYGLNLNALELLALGGDSVDVQIATAGTNVALSSSVMDTLHTYYKNVSYDNVTGVLTLDTKASPVTDLIGSWGTGNYIKAYNSADAANTSVGANLGYLDTQVKVNADDITDIQDDMLVGFGGNYIAAGTDVAANLEALDAQAKVNADAISGKTLTVDTSTGVATIKDGTTTAEVYTKDAAETIFAEKQAWTSKEFGYDTASTDAKTILTAAGFTNQTTGDTDIGLIDAALQLKTEKQNALTAGSGIDITSDVISVKDASLANFDAAKVTDSTEIAAVLADPTTASDANVLTEKAVVDGVSALFNQKQAWASKEFGYDTASTDAKTILTAAGFTNQTTGDSDVGLIDAALQLKADKQDKLVIAADSGLKWNDANQTQLAVKVNEDKGLKVTSNGIEINAGDTMQFSTSGKLDIKYDTNTFTATTTDGLKIASKGIKAGMIDDGAVSFANLATDAVATSITGATNKVATDKAVKDYAEKVVSDAITFNTDNTVTLTVGSNSANVYDKTGTENYVKANAQNADYTALTSGAVDLTSNSTIAQALQTLDAKKASLEKDNTFTGANTFKSDSGISIQNATTPSVQANLVAKQLTIGTDTHDILELTVSDTSGKGSALYVKDADIVTNSGFMALDASGTDRFSADEAGIETKDASGNTTFSVASATGNTTVAGTMDIEGNTTIGDYFSVTASDGSFSAAGGEFAVDGSGNTTIKGALGAGANGTEFQVGSTGNVYLGIDKLIARSDGSLTAAAGDFNVDTNGNTTIKGTLNAGANGTEFQVGSTGNVYVGVDKFTVDASDGSFNAAAGNFTVDGSGNVVAAGNSTVGGDLGVAGTAWLTDAVVSHDLAVANDATVGGNFAVAGTSYLHDTSVNGALTTTGAATIGGDLGVAGSSWLNNTHVNGDLDVSGTTKTGALTFDGTSYVAAMDQGAAAITGGVVDDQAKRTMATNATVAKTVGNLTALTTAANGVSSANDLADALNSLGANVETATGGTFDTAGVWTGTVTGSKAVDYSQNVAYNNLLSAIDQLSSNVGVATTAAKGNITSTKTVNANLDQLDAAIGDRFALTSLNGAINNDTQTSVAAGLEAAGNAIGDADFTATHYASADGDVSSAVRSLDSNLYRLENEVQDLRKDMKRGFASMAAMSAMVPNARASGNTQLSVGTGMYSGHTGFALGGFHWFNDNLMMNVGVAYGDGDSSDMIYRAGITYSW